MAPMTFETSQRSYGRLPIWTAKVWRWIQQCRSGESPSPAARGFLTQEQFQEELVVLGLSDRPFGPREYADALERHLDVIISIDVVPDADHPLLSRELARKGITGETRYRADLARAQIIVPGSLPPLALNFTLLHELGHLAAGDLFIDPHHPGPDHVRTSALPTLEVSNGRRLAHGLPFAGAIDREHEANLRAGYAFVAGCLGSENPYAQRMYDIL
jgi:hypothetical protein